MIILLFNSNGVVVKFCIRVGFVCMYGFWGFFLKFLQDLLKKAFDIEKQFVQIHIMICYIILRLLHISKILNKFQIKIYKYH